VLVSRWISLDKHALDPEPIEQQSQQKSNWTTADDQHFDTPWCHHRGTTWSHTAAANLDPAAEATDPVWENLAKLGTVLTMFDLRRQASRPLIATG
jgi:hypothetical protein